jgi:hypothetical protein
MGIHFLRCIHGSKHIMTHDVVREILLPLHQMLAFTWEENNYMHFPQS